MFIYTPASQPAVSRPAPAASQPWRVVGLPQSVLAAIHGIPLVGDPRTIAMLIIGMTRMDGSVTETASIDAATHTIVFRKARVRVEGPLKGYVSDATAGNTKALARNLSLLSQAAASYGGTPAINIGANQDGVIPVTASVRNPGIRYGVGASLLSFGPRYAGSDVASQYIYGSGYGYNGSLSFTEGLPSWTPQQSLGGYYYGISGQVTHPTPYGIFGITGSYARYREGGISRSLDLTGTQGLYGLTYAYPISRHWTVNGGLYYGDQTEHLGAVNFRATQDFLAARAGIDGYVPTGYRNGRIHIRTHFWDGFAGHTTGLLLGRPSSNSWQKITFNTSLFQPLPCGTAVQVKAGGQDATGNLPDQEEFTIGGDWRGSSYFTGQAAALSGMYAGIRAYAPVVQTRWEGYRFSARPFVGVDGSEGAGAFGSHLEAASALVGTKFRLTRYLNGEAGYAWSIDNQGPHKPDGRAFFDVVGSFNG